MNILGIIVLLGLGIIGMLYIFGTIRTYKMEHGTMHEEFMKGTANITLLDGDYIGTAHGLDETSWKGKTLDSANQTGINRFLADGALSNKYQFKFFVRKGLRDTDMDVIVLDYNQPGNPWWLTYIVDEMVETSPQTYIGKVHVKVMPGIVFTLGYFTLSK